jgi:ribulose-phosphate 3-epimerase
VHDLVVSPSILSADFSRLADEVADVGDAVPWLHVDVMDGHYVPNITIGQPVVRSLRSATDRFLDCHLMVADPRTYAPQFVALGAESVTFHPEVDDDPVSIVHDLHERGAHVGVALKPKLPLSLVEELLPHVDMLLLMSVEPGFGGQAFMPEVLPKIAAADDWRRERGAGFRIEVDGGITVDTVAGTVRAGADTIVAGSAVFDPTDRRAAVRGLVDAAIAARSEVGA